MVIVTFKNSYDKLVCVFSARFGSVKHAKISMEADARCFMDAHNYRDKHDVYVGKKRRASMRWDKKADYLEVKALDGTSCVWQYFIVK